MAEKKENRGGPRPNSGRKAIFELAAGERAKIIKDVAAVAEKNGTSFGTELGKLMYSKRGEKRTKLQAMRLFATDVLPKMSEREVTETQITKPQVFVPEKYPDSDQAPDYTASSQYEVN